MITELNTKEYQNLDATQTMLIKIYSKTCAPCKMLASVLKDVEKELPDFPIYAIEFNENEEIKTILDIRGVPTLIFMKDGKEIERMSGLQEKGTIIKQIQIINT